MPRVHVRDAELNFSPAFGTATHRPDDARTTSCDPAVSLALFCGQACQEVRRVVHRPAADAARAACSAVTANITRLCLSGPSFSVAEWCMEPGGGVPISGSASNWQISFAI